MNHRATDVFTEQHLNRLGGDVPSDTAMILPVNTDHTTLCYMMILHLDNTRHSPCLRKNCFRNLGWFRHTYFSVEKLMSFLSPKRRIDFSAFHFEDLQAVYHRIGKSLSPLDDKVARDQVESFMLLGD